MVLRWYQASRVYYGLSFKSFEVDDIYVIFRDGEADWYRSHERWLRWMRDDRRLVWC